MIVCLAGIVVLFGVVGLGVAWSSLDAHGVRRGVRR